MLSVPLQNISPDMRPSNSASPSPEGINLSRQSPDHDDDGAGLNGSSLLPPQRQISGAWPSSSPSKVVAAFREVLAESPIFYTQGSKTAKETPGVSKQHKRDWMCLLCISKNSFVTSPEACAVCGGKRHEANSKSHISSLTKASLELAKKWKHDDDSLSDTQQSRRFPRRNSFSSTNSVGSASTHKVSNTTNEPSNKKSKSTLGDLAMFFLASATSSSSRQLKTPHMSCDDEDLPTRPSRSMKANLYTAPSPTTYSTALIMTDAKPPRPTQRSASAAQASPSRPPRPLRRVSEPDSFIMPDLAGRPIPDDASDASVELPKRLDAHESRPSLDATVSTPMPSNSRLASLLTRLPTPFDHNTTTKNIEATSIVGDVFCDEGQAVAAESRTFRPETQRFEEDGESSSADLAFQTGSENWKAKISAMSTTDEVPSNRESFDTEGTEEFADISLQIDTMENGSRSEDAVSISNFSDEQASHLPAPAPKRHSRCYCFSYPVRFCVLVAILVGSVLAALSSVIHWNHVGSKISEAFGYPAPPTLGNTTGDPNAKAGLVNNVNTSPPSSPGADNTTSSTFSKTWEQLGNQISADSSNDNTVYQVILGKYGSFLAVGLSSSDPEITSGALKLYRLQEGTWNEQGEDIDGNVPSNVTKSFAFVDSSGLTLAVASSGSVRVYVAAQNATKWKQLGSTILVGGSRFPNSGHVSVALSSDGLTVAAGIVGVATHNNIFISNYWGAIGVFAYDFVTENWIQDGSDIVLNRLNEADTNVSNAGIEIQLSGNGKILAVRDWLTGNGHFESQSVVQVYESTNASGWYRKGDAIITDEVDGGFSLSEDGSRLAVTNDLESRVLQFDQKDWVPSGDSLPRGSFVAFAQNESFVVLGTSSTNESPGRVEAYTHEPATANNWSRVAPDLVASSAADGFGTAMSISQYDGVTLAISLRSSIQVYRLRGI